MIQIPTTQVEADSPALESLTDDALLHRYVKASDRDALEALFCRHADAAYATALRICRHTADAQDAVQHAFVKVMQNAAAYRGGTGIAAKTWIIKIVIGSCKNRIRSEVRRRKWEELASDEQDVTYIPEDPAADDDAKALAAAVLQELNGLPERYQMPILLHHCEGMSLKETAAALSVSENTLHMQLKRGLDRLRNAMGARGMPVSLVSIGAVLAAVPGEAAPASLLASILDIAHGVGTFAKSALPAAVVPAAVQWTVSALVLIGAGTAGVMLLPGRAVPPTPLAKPIFYHWDFNSPGVPAEFQVMRGTVRHVADEGAGKKGCLMASNALIRIDIPITNFPLRVRFKAAGHMPYSSTGYVVNASIGSLWLPARRMGRLTGASQLLPEEVRATGKPGDWHTYRDYYCGTYVSGWKEEDFHELNLVPMDPDGRVSLFLSPVILLDELTIQSISTNELPDVSLYLNAIARIPPDKRKGTVPVPELKVGRNTANEAPVVYMEFLTNCTADGLVRLAE